MRVFNVQPSDIRDVVVVGTVHSFDGDYYNVEAVVGPLVVYMKVPADQVLGAPSFGASDPGQAQKGDEVRLVWTKA